MTRRHAAAALCATALTGALSCGDSTGPPALASVEIAPGTATLLVAEQRQFSADARSLSGGVVTGVSISWRSTAELIATVSPGGLVTGVNAGDALIIASSGGLSDTSTVTVIPVTLPPAPVATVEVQPVDSLNIETGASVALQAIPRSATGFPLANRVIVWSTADPTTVEITADGTITAVKPGRVTISATSEGKIGTTLAISVQPPRDFSIADAHITQAIQSADQSVPMVQGNHAAINVLLTATPIKTFPMEVILRVTDGGGALLYADTLESTASTPGNAGYHLPNAQFLIPDSLVRAGVSWHVTRDPRGRVADDDLANDVFPRDGPRAINAVITPPIHVRFMNMGQGGRSTGLGANIPLGFLLMVKAVFPIDTVAHSIRPGPTFQSSAVFPSAEYWDVLLAEVDLARMLENAPDPDAYWYGVVVSPIPPGPYPPELPTGIAYVPVDPSSNGAGTRSAVGIQVGWDGREHLTNESTAHELGHMLGRGHAPCAVDPGNVDGAYPFLDGRIGLVGHDVGTWARGRIAIATAYAVTTPDFMGCGYPRWVSEYTYRGVLEWRGYTTPPALPRVRAAAQRAPVTRSLIVRGRVSATGAVELEPAFVADASATRPERRGAYRLEVRDASGRVLLSDDFAPAVLSHNRGGHFLFAIPITADVERAIASIEVRGPASRAQRIRSIQPAAMALRTTSPTIRRMSGGKVDLGCAEPNAQGILIRDASTGSLLGVSRSATATIDASAGQSVVITCSDGVASHATTVAVR